MSLGLGLFLIGIAIFFGGAAGMMIMSLFCANLRNERDQWERKYAELKIKYDSLLNKEV